MSFAIAALLDASREVVAWLVDDAGSRAVALGRGITLLANEARLRQHVFPARWFEASALVVEATDDSARVADAMSTNGAKHNGRDLPASGWRPGVVPAALLAGDAVARIAHLDAAWQPLREGDRITTVFPAATWRFTRAAPPGASPA